MENLLVIIEEIVNVLNLIFFVLIILLFVAPELVWGIFELLVRLFFSDWKKTTIGKSIRRIMLYAALVVLGMFILAFGSLLVINKYFFEDAVRATLKRVERNSDIAVTFEAARGSLWDGKLELEGARFKREDHEISNFDIRAKRFYCNANVRDIFKRKYHLDSVELVGVRGQYERLRVPVARSKQDLTVGKSKFAYAVSYEQVLPKKEFTIDNLTVQDLQLDIADKTRVGREVAGKLNIDSSETRGLFSQAPLWSVLFCTDAKGEVNQCPFQIRQDLTGDRRVTTWRFRDLPIDYVTAYIRGPLRWFAHGTLEVEVSNGFGWDRDRKRPEIEMDWQLDFSEFEAYVPDDLGDLERAVAKPAVAFLNKHQDDLSLGFELLIEEGKFERAASLEAVELFEVVEGAVVKAICERAGIKPEELRETGKAAVDKIKGWLEKKRR